MTETEPTASQVASASKISQIMENLCVEQQRWYLWLDDHCISDLQMCSGRSSEANQSSSLEVLGQASHFSSRAFSEPCQLKAPLSLQAPVRHLVSQTRLTHALQRRCCCMPYWRNHSPCLCGDGIDKQIHSDCEVAIGKASNYRRDFDG